MPREIPRELRARKEVVERGPLADAVPNRPRERLHELLGRLAPGDEAAEEHAHGDRGAEDHREDAEQVVLLGPWRRDLLDVVTELAEQLRGVANGLLAEWVEVGLDRRRCRVADAELARIACCRRGEWL